MKVCKLVRLTNKDEKGQFVNSKEGKITMRNRVVVSEESVAETEENYPTTGILYVVDAKATAERDAEVEAEVNEARGISGDEKKAAL